MRRSWSMKTGFAFALMAMLFSTFAVAQYGSRDDGQYRIISARYGTERNNVDVTARLKELAREDVRFRMGNSTFGVDPDRGAIKTLRIYARGPNGAMRTFEYREGSVVDGSIFTGWGRGDWGDNRGNGRWNDGWNGGWNGGNDRRDDGQYRILNARYGTPRNNVDVTARLKELARRDISFRMGNSTFGIDPAPGSIKMLRIIARGPRGETRNFDYREGSTVDGSLFTGWGRGDWGNERWNGGWGDRDDDRGGYGRGDDRGRGDDYGRGNYQSITIIRASYGAGGRGRDVTSILQSQVRNGRLDFTVNNYSLGGDPAPGARKSLTVIYTNGGRGEQRQASINEGGRLSIP